MKGSAFRLAGLILGIVASVAAVVAIVLSAVGMSKARQCKQCKLGGGVNDGHRRDHGKGGPHPAET